MEEPGIEQFPMPEQPYRKVQWDKFKALMNRHGLSPYSLAEKTKVNAKTIRNWQKLRARVSTFEVVARYLGVSYETLLANETTSANSEQISLAGLAHIEDEERNPPPLRSGTIKVGDDWNKWTQQRQDQFFNELRHILESFDEIKLTKVIPGCVELHVELTYQQADALQIAFAEGRLRPLRVTSVTIEPTSNTVPYETWSEPQTERFAAMMAGRRKPWYSRYLKYWWNRITYRPKRMIGYGIVRSLKRLQSTLDATCHILHGYVESPASALFLSPQTLPRAFEWNEVIDPAEMTNQNIVAMTIDSKSLVRAESSQYCVFTLRTSQDIAIGDFVIFIQLTPEP